MRSNLFKLTFLLLPTLFLSCSCFVFPDFSVKNYSYNESEIKIDFSSKPNISKIKDSFSLLEDNYLQEGFFETSGNTVIFKPVNKIDRNHDYKVLINTDAEDINGISLQNNFCWEFTTKVTACSLEILSFNQSSNSIEIEFNSPIPEKTFQNYISISPSVSFLYEWNNDNTEVKLKYQEPLSKNQIYFFSINEDLKDVYNNKLSEKFYYHFSTERPVQDTDYSISEINNSNTLSYLSSQTLNQGLLSDSELLLSFSNQVKYEDLLSAVSIIPQTTFTLKEIDHSEKNYKLTFQERPSYNSTLKVTIKDLKDIYSEKIEDRVYSLKFDNKKNIYPVFAGGIIKLSDESILFTENDNCIDINFPVDKYPTIDTIPSEEISVYLIFDTSTSDTYINKYSLIENLDFISSLNCISINPYSVTQLSSEETEAILQINNSDINKIKNPNTFKVMCKVENNDSTGLFKIKIGKDIKDSNGNTLGKKSLFIFNKK